MKSAKTAFHVCVCIVALSAVVLTSLVAQPAHADWHSLTGLLPDRVTLSSPQFSPDSAYIVYKADVDVDGQDELYSVVVTTTLVASPTKLNTVLVTGGDVINFAISPDSKSVVYTADQEVDERRELFVVPIAGGMPVKISGSMVSGGNVASFLIDKTSTRVVFTADRLINETTELFSVLLTGGAIATLNPAVGPGDVVEFRLDPASNRAVFRLDNVVNDRYALFSTPIAGGTFMTLSQNVTLEGFGVDSFQIYPTLALVIFSAQTSDPGEYSLYSVFTADGSLLNSLRVGSVFSERVRYYTPSPNDGRVIYEVSAGAVGTTTRTIHLYSVLIGGGSVLQLTKPAEPMKRQGPYDSSDSRLVTSDGKYLIYGHRTAPETDPNNKLELRSISLQGAPQYATLYTPPSSQEQLGSFKLSPDGQWVVYSTSSNGSQTTLHATPPNSNSPQNFGIVGPGWLITADSQRLIYSRARADYGSDIFSEQIFGGGLRNLTDTGGSYAFSPLLSPNNQWIEFGLQAIGPAPDRNVLGTELRLSDGKAAQVPTPTPTQTSTPSQTMTPTPTATPAFSAFMPSLAKP